MIVKMLLDLVFNVFSFLTAAINIPSLPDGVLAVLSSALSYIQVGAGVLASYTHLDYLFILLGIVIAVEVGVLLYRFVMFILRKIPMLGIE